MNNKAMKWFPILTSGRAKYDPTAIPWFVAELAYEQYVRENGRGQTLERMAERGGFGISELDKYVPGWRKMRR